jgi:glycosyltransferase involved in cell wall biosynthesis
MENVSVCIIARDEEENIATCLQSVSWADEKVVMLDSRSKDRTSEIAKELGAKVVIANDWPGWGKLKNRTIDEASYDWILSLDCDETLEPGAEAVIREAMTKPPIDSYTLSRKTYFLGKWIAHQGWYPDRQIRLFRKSATRFDEVPVHEKVQPTPHTADLKLDIIHNSYRDLVQYFEKNSNYTTAQAEQQKDTKLAALKMFYRPVARFGQTYILQLGFLDGWRGLQLSALRAWYEFTLMKKVLQLQQRAHQ